jgi:hypothetical protein
MFAPVTLDPGKRAYAIAEILQRYAIGSAPTNLAVCLSPLVLDAGLSHRINPQQSRLKAMHYLSGRRSIAVAKNGDRTEQHRYAKQSNDAVSASR